MGKSLLTQTEVVITGYNKNEPLLFADLVLNESLIHVNEFSFSLFSPDNKGSLNSLIDFKKKILGKDVELRFNDSDGGKNYLFKGVVVEVNSALTDDKHYRFHVSGKGIFSKIDEAPGCGSFYKKNLAAIIDGTLKDSKLKDRLNKNGQNSKVLHYTVQYNQTAFSFLSSLAIRFGEWMYYDGEKMQFGKKPSGAAIKLQAPYEVYNLNIQAHMVQSPATVVGTDIFKSELIKSDKKETAPGNPALKAAVDAGKDFFEDLKRSFSVVSGFKKDVSDENFKLAQQGIFSSSVLVTGNTRNSKLSVGKVIKIADEDDTAGKSFIITNIRHSVTEASHYENNFTAVPLEVPAPPYTNPLLTPKATAQHAIITDNEDKDGLARVKVKFPWMLKDEKSPWISVLTPHAGKNKGFRFIPEKDEEVLVDFWDGNAETPFVAGSVYTEKNKAGIVEKGNNVKMIGSLTGRSLVIDDDKKEFSISDGGIDPAKAKNLIKLSDNDKEKAIKIVSGPDDEKCTLLLDSKNKKAEFQIGDILSIKFDGNSKKMEIISKGDINISADGKISMSAKSDISLEATNINLKAKAAVKIEGNSEVAVKAAQVKLNANAMLEAKGAMAKVEGSGMVELKGGGMAKIQGAIVMIN